VFTQQFQPFHGFTFQERTMRKSIRRGFTLAEVLVTVTIVAVLAAVMVPAVINQVAKGDVPSVAQDMDGIRSAITTFAADVRRFPHSLSQLGGTTLPAASNDISGVQFGGDAAQYRGPYASIVKGHAGPTGAIFSDTLVNPGGTHNICLRDSTTTGGATGTSFISQAQMSQLNQALDHDTSTAITTGDTRGSVTWTATTVTNVITVTPGSVNVCNTTL
jgi:prepilin-type N-terminal cleavage/methylation domain-containing protein